MSNVIHVFDSTHTLRATYSTTNPGACPFYDDIHEKRLHNSYNTFEFKIPGNHPDAAAIDEDKSYVVIKDFDGYLQEFRVLRIENVMDDNVIVEKIVYCEHTSYELLDALLEPVKFSGATAAQYLDHILAGTRWQRGVVEWGGTRTIAFNDYPTKRSALNTVHNSFGKAIRFRVEIDGQRVSGRYVDLIDRHGAQTGKRLEYAKDIEGITKVEDRDGVYTALYGFGAADHETGDVVTFESVEWSERKGDPVDKPRGQKWVGDPEALQRWGNDGRHVFGKFEDMEISNPGELLQRTWEYLQTVNAPKYLFEVDAVLLDRLPGYEHEKIELGDEIPVIVRDIEPAITVQARVVEIKRSLSDPEADEVVLGDFIEIYPDVVEEARKKTGYDIQKGKTKIPTGSLVGDIDSSTNAVRDGSGNLLAGERGVLSSFVFTSSGEMEGWQQVGRWNQGGYTINQTGSIRFTIPPKFTVVDATLVAYSMPKYMTGFSWANGYYHVRVVRIYKVNQLDQTFLDFKANSGYFIVHREGKGEDVTPTVWGARSWSPDDESPNNRIVSRQGSIKSVIKTGLNELLFVSESTRTDLRNASLMQFVVSVTGYQY